MPDQWDTATERLENESMNQPIRQPINAFQCVRVLLTWDIQL